MQEGIVYVDVGLIEIKHLGINQTIGNKLTMRIWYAVKQIIQTLPSCVLHEKNVYHWFLWHKYLCLLCQWSIIYIYIYIYIYVCMYGFYSP